MTENRTPNTENSKETCGTCGRWYLGIAPSKLCQKRVCYTSMDPACENWIGCLPCEGECTEGRREFFRHQISVIEAAVISNFLHRYGIPWDAAYPSWPTDCHRGLIIVLCRTIERMISAMDEADKTLQLYKDVAHGRIERKLLGSGN